VLLNAGLRVWFAERAKSIHEGIEMARHAIDSGAAREKMETVRVNATRNSQIISRPQ
jgi:anthranilate phosphoribosyltransferase